MISKILPTKLTLLLLIGAIILSTLAGSYFFSLPGYQATTLLFIATTFIFSWQLIKHSQHSNRLAFDAIKSLLHNDYSAQITPQKISENNNSWQLLINKVFKHIGEVTHQQKIAQNYWEILLAQVPIVLFSIRDDGKVVLLNLAARSLFTTNEPTKFSDFVQFKGNFHEQLQHIKSGENLIVQAEIEGVSYVFHASATQINIQNKSERLISLLNIKTELDIAQVSAWKDLVHVLTHEIMNSIAPISSLSHSLVNIAQHNSSQQSASDLTIGLNAIAKRADGLMEFVTRYKQISQTPLPQPQKISLTTFIEQLLTYLPTQWQEQNIIWQFIPPENSLFVYADPVLLEQACINILKNAAQAVKNSKNPKVEIAYYRNKQGKTIIDIGDNGEGIEPEKLSLIFMPFYSSKADGSGIGLSLARQIILSHNGTITALNNFNQGTTIRISFNETTSIDDKLS